MTTGRKVILPVWHEVSKNEVAKYSQLLAGNFALRTQEGITKISEKLVEEIKGREYLEKMLRSNTHKKKLKDLTLFRQGKVKDIFLPY